MYKGMLVTALASVSAFSQAGAELTFNTMQDETFVMHHEHRDVHICTLALQSFHPRDVSVQISASNSIYRQRVLSATIDGVKHDGFWLMYDDGEQTIDMRGMFTDGYWWNVSDLNRLDRSSGVTLAIKHPSEESYHQQQLGLAEIGLALNAFDDCVYEFVGY